MTSLAPHQNPPLRTASGIFDDIELYPDRLIIRHRDIISRLREQAEILELSDIESVKNIPKRSDHSRWIQMKIICHTHKSVELSYDPSQRSNIRELTDLLNELRHHPNVQSPQD